MIRKKIFFVALAILMILAVLPIGASTTVFAASDLVLISYTNDAKSVMVEAVVKNNGPAKDITLVMNCYNAKGEIIAIGSADGRIEAKSTKKFYLINRGTGSSDRIEVFVVQNYGTGLMLVSYVNDTRSAGINAVLTNGGPAKDVTVTANFYNAAGEIISTDSEDGRIEQNSSKSFLLLDTGFGSRDSIEVLVDGMTLPLANIPAIPVYDPTVVAAPTSANATPTSSIVTVNDKAVAFDAYNINGNNYFKLRDLAYTLSGTGKQFAVGWDSANNSISLTSGNNYTSVGGEMTGKGSSSQTATLTSSRIYLNGNEVSFTIYNIGGNNYFKLRDIGKTFDFDVSWDGANNRILINTSESYTPD